MSRQVIVGSGRVGIGPAGDEPGFQLSQRADYMDGSYLMANSDVYSSVVSGHPFVLVLCDNGGFAVIDRLQVSKGAAHFNNLFDHVRGQGGVRVDFAAHARAMGADAVEAATLEDLANAFRAARGSGRTTVIVVRTDPNAWTPGDAWWDVGVPEVSEREEVVMAKAQHEAERKHQRTGV